MLKVFRDGLVLDVSRIIRIRTNRYSDETKDFKYFVEALLDNEESEILEFFETREDADNYVTIIAKDINYWLS